MVAVAVLEKRRKVDGPIDVFGPVPVQPLWPGSTVVCLGTGPSLTQEDVNACRGHAKVIAIKNAVTMAPWADAVYGSGADASGRTWWSREGPGLQFDGLRYTLDVQARRWASVLKMGPESGLSSDPSSLALGRHSGYQAIGLAVHLGAVKVILIGYDLQPTRGHDHFFGKHPHGGTPPFDVFLKHFPAIVKPLEARGVTVINCSADTALTIFPRMSLAEALS